MSKNNKNHKIDKINAYRKLLETRKLPKVDEASEKSGVESEIVAEFTTWAEVQLSNLLGEASTSQPVNGFSEEETQILKMWALSLKRRSSNGPKQEVYEENNEPKRTTAPTGSSQSAENGTARGKPKDVKFADRPSTEPLGYSLRKSKSKNLIEALEELEQQAPEF